MKITVFQSDKGDCLLVTGNDEKRVLVDGGMPKSYTKHVAPFLNKLRDQNKDLDVVYVSHIDADHIAGILQMIRDEVDWTIFDYQSGQGNTRYRKPRSRRPPKIKAFWHNAFDTQVGKNADDIGDLLAASAMILSGSDIEGIKDMALSYQELATSVKQAIQLSTQLEEGKLNIPLNPHAENKLMMVRDDNQPIKIGKMNWQIIGPFESDLAKLRTLWNKWLKKNKAAIGKIEVSSNKEKKKMGNLAASEIADLTNTAIFQAKLIGRDLLKEIDKDILAMKSSSKARTVLGRRSSVTAPNLASLMFLVEEKAGGKTKTVLLTGDGHQDDILKGLEKGGKLDNYGCIHVDILKVQHHGSKNNIDRNFLKHVTADHYVFCGNGGHHNPHVDVVDVVIDSRLEDKHRGDQVPADGNFKLWFNCNAKNFESDDMSSSDIANTAHMKELEKIVTVRQKKSGGKMKNFFLKSSHFSIDL